jgi:hypothetical protein
MNELLMMIDEFDGLQEEYHASSAIDETVKKLCVEMLKPE